MSNNMEVPVPAYLIVDVVDIRDAPLYENILEGDWPPTRVVLARFASLAAGRRWWASAEYAELKAMRRQATTCHMILVDGLPDKET